MRYFKYLTEDVVSSALSLPEPKVGGNYPPEKVKRYISMIEKALSAMSNKEESESNDAIVADLRDKKSKWKNVKSETKPKKTINEPPMDQQEEPPPEDQQDDQDKQPPPQKKESTLLKYFNLKEDQSTQKYFEKLLKDFKAGKITQKEMYKKMLSSNPKFKKMP